MADMARILLIYHYGGIYMDTDFYCYRPFSCLIDQVYTHITSYYKSILHTLGSKHMKAHSHSIDSNRNDSNKAIQRNRRLNIHNDVNTSYTKKSMDNIQLTATGQSTYYHHMLTSMSHVNLTEVPLLLISQEPKIHSYLFRNKDRVIIQDFFLSTKKHPFFKWILDNHNQNYQESIKNKEIPRKGPFSYSIEKDIDEYRQLMLDMISGLCYLHVS